MGRLFFLISFAGWLTWFADWPLTPERQAEPCAGWRKVEARGALAARGCLERWQQIVRCDFDERPRQRQVTVTVLGESVVT